MRIGLLGGSFNPPHEGHRYISKEAIKRLRLDQVWWMVTPQNPLKSSENTPSLEKRLEAASQFTKNHPKIEVTDIETQFGTIYTRDTLARLKDEFPNIRFVWLMGADNLTQIPLWHQWQDIFKLLPIAIFDRPGYTYKALNGKAASYFARHRVAVNDAKLLAELAPPAWCFLPTTQHPSTSTKLRCQKD